MFYLRVVDTKDRFMGIDFSTVDDLKDAVRFKTRLEAAARIKMFKHSMGTVERTYKFEIVSKEVATYGIANINGSVPV